MKGVLKTNLRNNEYYIDSFSEFALLEFRNKLLSILKDKCFKKIVLLCIGTDKATGDSLGPLVGYKLSKLPMPSNIIVLGTLEKPVHAKNLSENLEYIYKEHKDSLVIAVDASLGDKDYINFITLGEGSIKPGAGVKKNLPKVGDLFITGIVNSSTLSFASNIQSVRLFFVMNMADIISSGIWHCVNSIDIY